MTSQQQQQQHDENSTIDNTTSTSQPRSTRKRGVTIMKRVVVNRSNGKRQKITFDEDGLPIGDGSTEYSGYLGKLSRERIPIYKTADELDHQLLDELWKDILDTFELDNPRAQYHYAISKIKTLAKDFRSRLTKIYMENEELYKSMPPEKCSHITPEDWAEFVKIRDDPEFKKKSRQNRERAKNPKLKYRGSRKGLARVREDVRVKRIENGESCGDIPRWMPWLAVRKNKDGDIVDDDVQKVADKIYSLCDDSQNGGI